MTAIGLRLVLFIFAFFVLSSANAQEDTAAVANQKYRSIVVDRVHDLNVATGFSTSGNPLHVDLSFRVIDHVSISPELGLTYYNRKGLKGNGIHFGLRGQYNLDRFYYLANHIDIYTGLSYGFEFWIHDFSYTNFPHVNASRFTGFIGYKQFFDAQRNLAFHIEIHAGNYYGLHGGITYRIY